VLCLKTLKQRICFQITDLQRKKNSINYILITNSPYLWNIKHISSLPYKSIFIKSKKSLLKKLNEIVKKLMSLNSLHPCYDSFSACVGPRNYAFNLV